MPFESIKKWQYARALKKLPSFSATKKKSGTKINPARQFLLFFDGTNERDLHFFQSLHQEYEKQGLKIKMLAFIRTKGELQHFALALYNEKSVNWNGLPKPKLIELVQSRQFDILFNINPNEYPHMHFLAVAASADFKVSTKSSVPQDFNLIVNTDPSLDQTRIYREMTKCLDTLSIKDQRSS